MEYEERLARLDEGGTDESEVRVTTKAGDVRFVRIEAGAVQLDIRPVSLDEVVRQCLDTHAEEVTPGGGATFAFHLPLAAHDRAEVAERG